MAAQPIVPKCATPGNARSLIMIGAFLVCHLDVFEPGSEAGVAPAAAAPVHKSVVARVPRRALSFQGKRLAR